MTIPYADMELHPGEELETDPPRSGAVIVYVLVALVVAGVLVWWCVR